MSKYILTVILLGFFLFNSCNEVKVGAKGSKIEEKKVEDYVDEEATPEEKKYIEAARPMFESLCQRNYQLFFDHLSLYARFSMSLNQFSPESDDAKFEANEKNPLKKVTFEQFAEQMKKVEALYGLPQKPESLSVQSIDPKILSRKGTEETAAFDSMLAIGAMPETVPFNLRRASLRGQVLTKLSAEELAKIAKEEEMTVEELEKNENFKPYFTVKLVLIEEGGVLKIGYFEFLPPMRFD